MIRDSDTGMFDWKAGEASLQDTDSYTEEKGREEECFGVPLPQYKISPTMHWVTHWTKYHSC